MKDMNKTLKHAGWHGIWLHKTETDLVVNARLCHATPDDLRRLATGLELMAKHVRTNAENLVDKGHTNA